MAVLNATIRTEAGTRKARALRVRGQIPCVIYGHGEGTVSASLEKHDLELAVNHGQRLLEIDLEGKIENVLISEVQWDVYGQETLHVDLTRVDLDELVTVTVPIVLRGTPVGLDDGGSLQQAANEVEIECAVRSIPEKVEVLVAQMKIDDAIYMSGLDLPEGSKLLNDPESMVCSITVIQEEVEEAPAEEGEESAQPEVIGEKADDEETDEDSASS